MNPAVVVYQRQSGITAADLRKAAADARAFAALPAVHGRVAGPIPSRDHQALETIVGANLGYNANISAFISGLNSRAAAGDPGLTVHITGPAASAADEVKIFKGIDTTLLYATLAVVISLLLAMITLLPALLVIFGRWIFWPVRPGYDSAEPTATGPWARTGRSIARLPRAVWVVTAVLLACAALGMIGFRVGPLTNAQSFRGTPPSVAGEQVLARHFPAGAGEPVAVIGNAKAAAALRSALAGTAGIAAVTPPETRGGLTYLQGTLTGRPDSQAAYATVDRVRAATHRIAGADAKVGGGTAITMDVERYATRDRNVIIPLILLVVLVILGLLLRAVVAPLVLIGTVILSFGAALGLSALAFRHLFGFAGMDTSVPLFIFVFLVALGIDYNIFLMTRVREESQRAGTRRGALTGLAATGGVITSAGTVLAGTFAMLATLPLVTFTEIGFAVAIGVLLDTIIVRSVLVTALTLDIGRWMWWPSRMRPDQRGQTISPAATQPVSSG
jgi:RND superfamily putative drug exporter